MSVDIEKAISFMYDLKKRGVKYSMYGSRTGSDGTADCSGAVYQALAKSGGSKLSYPFSTESAHAYLLNNGFQKVSKNKNWTAKRGDITIWGMIGQSAGAGGHMGIWISGTQWIECTAYQNGVIVSNHDNRWAQNGEPYFYTYRLKAQAPGSSANSKWIKEKATFYANTTISLRDKASTSGKIIGRITSGQAVKYDQYIIDTNGYVWIRQPRSGGKYGYLATGQSQNGKRINYWGQFY